MPREMGAAVAVTADSNLGNQENKTTLIIDTLKEATTATSNFDDTEEVGELRIKTATKEEAPIIALEIKTTADSNPNKQQWKALKGLDLHSDLFKKGVLVVRPTPSIGSSPVRTSRKNILPDDTQFTLNSRELIFGNSTTTNAKKPINLLKTLEASCGEPPCSSSESPTILIYNKARRDEIFLPVITQDPQGKKLGFYVYPWLSLNNSNFEFSGIKKYVVAGCIFGSSLKARDDNDGTFPLIKHDIKLYNEQKIVDIEFNLAKFGSYERMLFSELEKLALLMKKFSNKDEQTELYYHLPYYDYILFGVELFVRGRITFDALDLFFNAMFQRKMQHEREIRRICQAHSISVKIESPFENIFGTLPTGTTEYAQFIFDKLGLSQTEIKPLLDAKSEKEHEAKLVEYCASQLTTNTHRPEHRQVWEDLLSIKKDKIDDLEKLFKLANAAMIAIASKENKNYETCSLLPVSEKQIQLGFAELNKQLGNKYPAVVNMTTLDPLITYDPVSRGLLFYFRGDYQEKLRKLITKQDWSQRVHENIAHHAIGNTMPTPPLSKPQ